MVETFEKLPPAVAAIELEFLLAESRPLARLPKSFLMALTEKVQIVPWVLLAGIERYRPVLLLL